MSLKKIFGVASLAALVGGISLACSSTVTGPGADPNADSGPGGSKTDTSTPGPKTDSGTPLKDGSVPPPDDAGPTCAPADVTAFKPVWKPPTAKAQGACTQTQIDTYLTACLGATATAQTCAPFQMGAGLKCAQCIETRDTDAKLGPLVSHGGYVVPNVAGCVAVALGDTMGTGCAGKLLNVDQCAAAACKANCPVTDDASLAALDGCTKVAEGAGGGCETYATAANCADALVEAGGAAADCLGGKTFQDSYNAIVPQFCGGAGDAGGG